MSKVTAKFNYKTLIIILSWILVVFSIMTQFSSLFQYDLLSVNESYDGYIVEEYGFKFNEYFNIHTFIRILFFMSPYVLFAVYVTFFRSKYKAPFLMHACLFLHALVCLPDAYFYLTMREWDYCVFFTFLTIAYMVAAICVLKGADVRWSLLPALSIEVIYFFFSLVKSVEYFKFYIEDEWYDSLISQVFYLLSVPLFIAAFLLFAFNSKKIPRSFKKAGLTENILAPEKELSSLKAGVKMGTISAEEYEMRKQYILNNL